MIDAGCPCGEINDIGAAFDNPQVKHLRMSQPVNSAVMGEINLVSQPVKLERTPSHFEVAPPERGEHTDEVLTSLGYNEAQIAALRDQQVV